MLVPCAHKGLLFSCIICRAVICCDFVTMGLWRLTEQWCRISLPFPSLSFDGVAFAWLFDDIILCLSAWLSLNCAWVLVCGDWYGVSGQCRSNAACQLIWSATVRQCAWHLDHHTPARSRLHAAVTAATPAFGSSVSCCFHATHGSRLPDTSQGLRQEVRGT